jgi:ABC-type Fe3+-hydroxamate transport system substrate-binding protein
MTAYEKKVTNVTSSMPETDKPKVYWMWGDILGTAGLNSTANELIEEAGGVNRTDKTVKALIIHAPPPAWKSAQEFRERLMGMPSPGE